MTDIKHDPEQPHRRCAWRLGSLAGISRARPGLRDPSEPPPSSHHRAATTGQPPPGSPNQQPLPSSKLTELDAAGSNASLNSRTICLKCVDTFRCDISSREAIRIAPFVKCLRVPREECVVSSIFAQAYEELRVERAVHDILIAQCAAFDRVARYWIDRNITVE